ncbi:hypothetical protein KM22_02235 [Bordetella bronchiseptica KM22]|nr:hypothetical protein KM22_02235 [Bordetella bronchiseptica KM22]
MLGKDAPRFGRIDGAYRGRVGDVERFAGPHQVHVVLDEGLGIGAPQRHQHLVDAGAGHGIALGDAEQRIAASHVDGAGAGLAGRCGRAHAGRRHARSAAARRHQDGDLDLPLAGARAQVQQHVDRVAGRRLAGRNTHVAARRVGTRLDTHGGAGQRHRRSQAGLAPGRFVGQRNLQGGQVVGAQFEQGHHDLQGGAGRRNHPRVPEPGRLGPRGPGPQRQDEGPRKGL